MTHNSGVSDGASTWCEAPLMLSVIMDWLLLRQSREGNAARTAILPVDTAGWPVAKHPNMKNATGLMRPVAMFTQI
jgi:hypothetical protein